jgi:hypothetical protein
MSMRYKKYLVGVFLVLTVVLIGLLRDELLYFFSANQPEELGQAEDLTPRALTHNSFYRISGIARDLCVRAEVFSTSMRFLYLLGSDMGARILIQSPTKGGEGCDGAVDSTYEGRLLDLSRTGRYFAVVEYYRTHFPFAPQSGALYLLQAGERPRQAWWYPTACGVLLLLGLINLWMLWRGRSSRNKLLGSDTGEEP